MEIYRYLESNLVKAFLALNLACSNHEAHLNLLVCQENNYAMIQDYIWNGLSQKKSFVLFCFLTLYSIYL